MIHRYCQYTLLHKVLCRDLNMCLYKLQSKVFCNGVYLNTSLDCIRNHYNRHRSQVQKGLSLLQPLTQDMRDAFQEFQDSIPLEEEVTESTFYKRYVRQSLDQRV